MENSNSQIKLEITPVIVEHLEATRKWALFLSIVGFVFMVLMVAFGFSFGLIFKELERSISPQRLDIQIQK